MIKLKRAYEPATRDDGARFLVERLWPRGIRKTELELDGWLKEWRPSPRVPKVVWPWLVQMGYRCGVLPEPSCFTSGTPAPV